MLPGCTDVPDALEAYGSVSYQGRSVESGTIILHGEGGKCIVSGEIVDGQFDITAEQGLVPGNYRVEIYANEKTGRTIPDPDDAGTTIQETRQILPERYNSLTELTREIDPTTDELVFELE